MKIEKSAFQIYEFAMVEHLAKHCKSIRLPIDLCRQTVFPHYSTLDMRNARTNTSKALRRSMIIAYLNV